MAHDRDHDHPPVAPPPKPKAPPLASRPKPDSKLREHPDAAPREPVDPRTHPGRW
jgi:hypothetical protein